MKSATVLIQFDDLHEFVAQIFRAAGMSNAHAAIEADVLTWANLRGVDSHGIFRIPSYINAINAGDIDPRADIHIVQSIGASSVIEANHAAGAIAMDFAARQAVTIAKDHAIGMALVRNTTHTGPIGYYARIAAEANMIGITTCASKPLMAYHGTRATTVATNPLAIAVPRADGSPVAFDMATAAIAWGKLTQARQAGTPLPENVALDADGHVTSDPSEAAIPLPLAGAKGAGLSVMLECITSLLAGAPLVTPALTGNPSYRQHGLAIAVDIAAFTSIDQFAQDAAELVAVIKAQPRADGFDEVLAPGERGDTVFAERRKKGIPVPEDQWRTLVEVAKGLGVKSPRT